MQKKIYRGLDVLKIILALMIIFLHTNPFPKDGVFYSLSKAFANVGVLSCCTAFLCYKYQFWAYVQ